MNRASKKFYEGILLAAFTITGASLCVVVVNELVGRKRSETDESDSEGENAIQALANEQGRLLGLATEIWHLENDVRELGWKYEVRSIEPGVWREEQAKLRKMHDKLRDAAHDLQQVWKAIRKMAE